MSGIIREKSGGRPFPPGNNLNPAGRPRVDAPLKIMNKLTALDFMEDASLLWRTSQTELAEIIKDPHERAGRKIIASVMLHAIKNGDASRMSAILDRLIGRPKEYVNLSGSLGKIDPNEIISLEQINQKREELNQKLVELRGDSTKPSNSD